MPPRVVRRMLVGPLWVLFAALSALLSPIAAIASLVTGNRQPLRLAHFIFVYVTREATVLAACVKLWVASGFGRRLQTEHFLDAHYRLLGRLLGGILRPVLKSLEIDIAAEPSEAAETALAARHQPLILFSRHAGPGDSFLVVNALLERYDRRPRIVMKQTLALDPALDVLCNRLPNALIDTSDPDKCERQISRLSRDLDGRGVLVLFPEGGNYTPKRRRDAIKSLRRRGHRSEAARAEQMTHVMPPKMTGASAALNANPEADVIFAAHTGLGHEAFPLEMWRNPPTDRTVRMRMWLAPAAERPTTAEQQTDWLFQWWKRLDDWIESQGQEPA
ncbi:MAG: 1-acyl-sn-glycerol-3-phosphate acyltransferase [Solirubrobacteraceae bacterium]